MIPETIKKMYFTLEEIGEIKGLKPTKVRYIIELLHIPHHVNRYRRGGGIRVHRDEVKRYFR